MKVLFLLGADDSSIPQVGAEPGLLSDDDRTPAGLLRPGAEPERGGAPLPGDDHPVSDLRPAQPASAGVRSSSAKQSSWAWAIVPVTPRCHRSRYVILKAQQAGLSSSSLPDERHCQPPQIAATPWPQTFCAGRSARAVHLEPGLDRSTVLAMKPWRSRASIADIRQFRR